MSTPNKWMLTRLGLVALGGVSGLDITSPDTVAKSNVDWMACVILLLVCPIALLAVVGLQAISPMSAPFWRWPSWSVNPLQAREPLQFFHLGAFFFMAGGVVGLGLLPFRDSAAAPLAVSLLSIGIGLWIGVQLGIKVYRKKMVRE